MASNSPFSVFATSKNSQKRKIYLDTASVDALNAHPETVPVSLRCPLSGQVMAEPVYTPDGFAYDKKNILKALASDKRDPLSRARLTATQLDEFPELLPHIKLFINRQTVYIEKKAQLMREARAIANSSPLSKNPSLFLCPISKKPINDPVITATGKIYDREALSDYLKNTGNLDETKCRLTLADVVPFLEFKAQIKVYEFYLGQQKKPERLSSPSHNACSLFSFCNFNILQNLFWKSEECNTTLKIK